MLTLRLRRFIIGYIRGAKTNKCFSLKDSDSVGSTPYIPNSLDPEKVRLKCSEAQKNLVKAVAALY